MDYWDFSLKTPSTRSSDSSSPIDRSPCLPEIMPRVRKVSPPNGRDGGGGKRVASASPHAASPGMETRSSASRRRSLVHQPPQSPDKRRRVVNSVLGTGETVQNRSVENSFRGPGGGGTTRTVLRMHHFGMTSQTRCWIHSTPRRI